ncbi:MAG: paraquat-inducible protein A [Phycisphaeraceae bacterium]|nr:MAG: paraquat-inducible protein A [Phycisphaeraceae bacterium]
MLPLAACHCCGLVHRMPALPRRSDARCTRCRSVIRHGAHPRSSQRAAALTLTALMLYPLALFTPVMTIERLGHTADASIWRGTISLLAEGHYAVGFAILCFSIIAPVAKLAALFTLTAGGGLRARQRAATYRFVEWIGRWGMVDVLLVAVLVAIVKLGDLVEVTPGIGVVAFGAVVVLSMLASAAFDPHQIWEDEACPTT